MKVCAAFMMVLLMYFNAAAFADNSEKSIVVVIPSYNNAKWLEKNLISVLQQKYTNFRVIYLNDASKDGTGSGVEELLDVNGVDYRTICFDDEFADDIASVKKFVSTLNLERHDFTLVNNVNRCGSLANIVRAIYSCEDDAIIVLVDGDDWLYDDEVLTRVSKAYNGNVWLTHGCLVHYPSGLQGWSEPIPRHIIATNSYRSFKCPSHLRTFYAWLFKKIKLADLQYRGKFFQMTGDMALMFPMIEMAAERHVYFSEVNYVYNIENQLNDNKVDPQLQNDLDWYIRHQPPYQRLKGRFTN